MPALLPLRVTIPSSLELLQAGALIGSGFCQVGLRAVASVTQMACEEL